MTECGDIIEALIGKDAKAACALAEKIAEESRESDVWYKYIDDFVTLLHSPNSLVRNRGIIIIAENARWDTENRYEGLMDEFLMHIEDEKPITARQCIKALPKIGLAKPSLISRIREALQNADITGYRDSMRPLILQDIIAALAKLS